MPPPTPRRATLSLLVVIAGLAAAAAILNGALGGGPWRLAASRGAGRPTVDGRPVADPVARELARRLEPGARLRLPADLAIEIESRGALRLALGPGADVTVPRRPGRWWGRRVTCQLGDGALHAVGGPRFAGATLVVVTKAASVRLRPGAAAVASEPHGTRIGVLAGAAVAAIPGAPDAEVAPGAELFVHVAALPPERSRLAAHDRSRLTALGALR